MKKILRPSDFFCGISWERLKEVFKEMPLRTILALLLNYIIALVMFLVYYVTYIPRWINESVESFTEWNL